jgi:hypothetical protein
MSGAECAFLPYRPLPFVAGIGAQVSAKRGLSLNAEVIDRSKSPHNTGKIGPLKNTLPLPAPRFLVRFQSSM